MAIYIRQCCHKLFRTFPVMKFHISSAEPVTQYHEIKDQTSGVVRNIAYKKLYGPRPHGLIYIPGMMAHKAGAKATALHTFAKKYGFPYVRYDPTGLGESKGIHLRDAKFSHWVQDAREVLLNVADGPQIIVASSMGCWVSSILAAQNPDKFPCLVLLAPAINFHVHYEKVLKTQLPPNALQTYENGGIVSFYSPDYGNFYVSKELMRDLNMHMLSREPGRVAVVCPVRIIHGVKDKDVPYQQSLELMSSFQSEDVHLTYIKAGGHSLKDEQSLDVIYDTILNLSSSLMNMQK